MKSKMERHIFQRSMKAGEVMDESAKPIHLNMLYDLARAFALARHPREGGSPLFSADPP